MIQKLFFLLLMLVSHSMLNGQDDAYSWENQPPILENRDSIILYSGNGENIYLKYRPLKFQTIYRISRFFGSEAETVYAMSGLDGSGLPENTVLKIPMNPEDVITNFWGRSIFKKYTPVYYKVSPKETLFHIAKKIFNVEMKVLKRRNHLGDNSLQSGQLLHIGWFPEEGLFEPITSREMEEDGYSWEELELTFAKAVDKGKVSQQKGVAFWNKEQTASEGLYVLHKEADVNSYIEIINPMFGTKIYAKVVGRIPENAYPSEILAILSPSAARELKARDARFFVKMRYLQPESKNADSQ